MKRKSKANTLPKICVYGPPGCGKSYAAATWPDHVVLIQTEPGICTASAVPGFDERAEVYQIGHWDELTQARADFDKFLVRSKIEVTPRTIIIVDSLTWVSEKIKSWVLGKYPSKFEDVPDMSHWRIISEQLRQFILALARSEHRIYATAQTDLRQIGEPGAEKDTWCPNIAGKNSWRTPHDFDFFFFARPLKKGKDVIRQVVTQPGASHIARSRAALPKTLPLDLGEIFSTIEGG